VEFDRDDGDDCVELLRLFHEESYIRFVKKMSDIGEGLLDYGDTPAFPQCYEAYSHVVKASAEMCRVLSQTQHAVNLYGGLHHAQPNRASGFCVFNDVAIAIRTPGYGFNQNRVHRYRCPSWGRCHVPLLL